MNFLKLQKNIIDVIVEEQVKLGYCKETIRLYYPIQSLNRFLETDFEIEEMKNALKQFSVFVSDSLGEIEISNKNARFCILIPPAGVEKVYQNRGDVSFLSDFVSVISKHGGSFEEICEVFWKHSEEVHIEKVDNGEFDYLVYFENGTPDEYCYCITDEGCHFIYHRYTKEDYEDFL